MDEPFRIVSHCPTPWQNMDMAQGGEPSDTTLGVRSVHHEHTLKTNSTFQSFWKILRTLRQGSANYGPWNKWGPLLVNKVLLKQGHTDSFPYCLWPLSGCNSRGERLWPRPWGPRSLNHLLAAPLWIKFADCCCETVTDSQITGHERPKKSCSK